MKTLYLIDNSNFMYRFKSVHKYASFNKNGVSVDISALVGYIRALKANIFDDICIVLDGFPQTSVNLLPSYKGLRNHEKDGTELSIPRIELIKFLSSLGKIIHKNIKVVCSPQQEADQVISSIVHYISKSLPPKWKLKDSLNQKDITSDRYLKYLSNDSDLKLGNLDLDAYDSVVIATTDSDMTQLQRLDNVFYDSSTTGKQISAVKTAEAVCGVNCFAVVPYKSIFGDDSDNVPGLKLKVSKTEISDLLNKTIKSKDSMDAFYNAVVYNNAHEFPPRLSKLIADIRSANQVSSFERNWGITYLDFYSLPKVIEFNNYNIDSTIQKYALKINV